MMAAHARVGTRRMRALVRLLERRVEPAFDGDLGDGLGAVGDALVDVLERAGGNADRAEAMAAFEAALAIDEHCYDAIAGRASVLAAEDRLDEALAEYRRARKLLNAKVY